jgi:hypothetical protein
MTSSNSVQRMLVIFMWNIPRGCVIAVISRRHILMSAAYVNRVQFQLRAAVVKKAVSF